jgi:hypothetical protein
MKKYALLLLTFSLVVCSACNKKEKEETAYQDNSSYPQYDSKNIVTYKGQILSIISMPDPTTGSDDIGILVRTSKGDIPVQLGPRSFVMSGPMNLNTNAQVEIKGSEIYLNGMILIIAKEVTVEGYTLKLRDGDGAPLWSGWKKN